MSERKRCDTGARGGSSGIDEGAGASTKAKAAMGSVRPRCAALGPARPGSQMRRDASDAHRPFHVAAFASS